VNDFEKRIADGLKKQGFMVFRNGWPDLLVLSADYKRGFALEIKRGKDKLSEEQKTMHMALARFGILTKTVREQFLTELNEHNYFKKNKTPKVILPETLQTLKNEVRDNILNLESTERKILEQKKSNENMLSFLNEITTIFNDYDEELEKMTHVGNVMDKEDIGKSELYLDTKRLASYQEAVSEKIGIGLGMKLEQKIKSPYSGIVQTTMNGERI
jgi:vacuolar-type H+-ATPase subunit I/STV1